MAGMIEQIECKFVIRWRDNVTTDNALDHDGRLYDIVSVEEHGYREALSLFARAQ
jgi:head-tail adaptor